MIGPNNRKATLYQALNANTALVNFLTARSSADEIRDLDWQGRDFLYPAVRFSAGTESPSTDGSCHPYSSNWAFQVYAFSETKSAAECGQLAVLIHEALTLQKLTVYGQTGSLGIRTNLIITDQIPAPVRASIDVWRCQVGFRTIINGGLP